MATELRDKNYKNNVRTGDRVETLTDVCAKVRADTGLNRYL